VTGRPTKYTEDVLSLARDYLDGAYLEPCENENENEVIPSVAGLSAFIGISRSRVYEWAGQEDKAEFKDILESILAKQERILVNNGLKGTFNSAIAKLALGKHGYSDKSENTHQGPGGEPVQFNFIGVPTGAGR
jgi:hypothetical protein